MKPTTKIATARTPGGSELVLYQHDESFFIRVDGEMLMHSRQHESELALARLGCAELGGVAGGPRVVGGGGGGDTGRAGLCLFPPGRTPPLR